MNAKCSMCGNKSGYDEDSLKASTWNINGIDNVLCCPCEDDLRVKLLVAIDSDVLDAVVKKHNLTHDQLDEILTTLREELLKEDE